MTIPADWLAKGYVLNRAGELEKARAAVQNDGPGQSTSERELHDQILDLCRSRGYYVVHARMDMRSTIAVGAPDFVVFLPGGRVLVVEAKTRTGKLSTEQQACCAWLSRLGHVYNVVRSIENFEALL